MSGAKRKRDQADEHAWRRRGPRAFALDRPTSCPGCELPMPAGGKAVAHGGRPWHAACAAADRNRRLVAAGQGGWA